MMDAEEKISRKELEELLEESGCKGGCFGVASATIREDGKCPDPCNKQKLALVAEFARDDAKQRAICLAGQPCRCVGKHKVIVPAQCCTMKDAEGNAVCLYYASYAYHGRCGYFV